MDIMLNSQYGFLPGLMDEWEEKDVKNEPMLFSCNLKSAYQLGGPITKNFLDLMPKDIKHREDFIVDSRVHMLMPGWYPAIPGIHTDDVPRTRSDKQPNYHSPEYHARHCMCLINGDIAPTRFYSGICKLPSIPLRNTNEDPPLYAVWHPIVKAMAENNQLKITKAPSRSLLDFDWQTLHECVPAVKNGFRWFIRASWNTHRKPQNELRMNANVYLEKPMEGW